MREFKFIRGKYTNENIFNTDETSNCLFAYDSKGKLVSFDKKNDEDFQNKFAGLSSEDRLSKIYTFRPSQFTISATKKGDSYTFTFVANETTYDNSESIPEEVRNAAEPFIKSETTANIKTTDNIPKLNIEGNPIEKTPVEFTFNNNKTFTRNLVFKVSGKLKESGYLLANGETTAYSNIADNSSEKSGVFYNGHYQSEVQSQQKAVILSPLEVKGAGDLNIATSYTPKNGFIFVVNKQIKSSVDYSDDLEFSLYTKSPNDNSTITENGTTYYFVGECTVKPRENGEIVKGYETSYEGNYVLKESTLIQVADEDLTKKTLDIYDSDEYHIINSSVYEDNAKDTNEYFMHISNEENIEKNITNENAYVNESGVVSPLIEEHIFREIISINVTATQSDD